MLLRLKRNNHRKLITMKRTTLFIVTLMLGLYSCTSDNQEEFYDSAKCDTSKVTFSATVDPIIANNCKSCHSVGSSNGVTLVAYSDIKKLVDNGRLMGSIKHQAGYSPMPQGGKLDDCTIAKLDAWINDGALDD